MADKKKKQKQGAFVKGAKAGEAGVEKNQQKAGKEVKKGIIGIGMPVPEKKLKELKEKAKKL